MLSKGYGKLTCIMFPSNKPLIYSLSKHICLDLRSNSSAVIAPLITVSKYLHMAAKSQRMHLIHSPESLHVSRSTQKSYKILNFTSTQCHNAAFG